MIIDSIKNCDMYTQTDENLRKGFEFIKSYLKNPLEAGRYEIDGDKVYAMVQEYETKVPGKFEAHKKYTDIQYLVSGKELIGYANVSSLTPETAYDAEKDFMLFERKNGTTELILEGGMFAVFYPEDGHMPGCMVEKAENVVKIVVKVIA